MQTGRWVWALTSFFLQNDRILAKRSERACLAMSSAFICIVTCIEQSTRAQRERTASGVYQRVKGIALQCYECTWGGGRLLLYLPDDNTKRERADDDNEGREELFSDHVVGNEGVV